MSLVLTPEQTKTLYDVVVTANVLDIDNIIIDDETIRGINDTKTAVLLQPNTSIQLGRTLGLQRLQIFKTRFNIGNNLNNFSVILDDDDDFIKHVVFKADGFNVTFKCADPALIVAPKGVNFATALTATYEDDLVTILTQSISTMKSDVTTLIYNNGNLTFEMADDSGDILSYNFQSDIVESSIDSFAHRYPSSTLLKLLKAADNQIVVDEKGILRLTINGLNTYSIPKI